MDHCPQCDRPYGKRKRCYFCNGRPPTGEMKPCARCGTLFYASGWQLRDKRGNNQAQYCSRACKYAAMKGRLPSSARIEEKLITQTGYVLVWAPDHPRAGKDRRVFEHVLVAEQMLGRPLTPDERVHHKDHNRANNDPSNLEVLPNSKHSALHAAEHKPLWDAQRVSLTCAECGVPFLAKPSRANATDPRSRAKYCSRPCRIAAVSRMTAERHLRNRLGRLATS